MTQRIHRDKLMFHWITKNHEIVVGFRRARHGTCGLCRKNIPEGDTLCDTCFENKKEISKK